MFFVAQAAGIQSVTHDGTELDRQVTLGQAFIAIQIEGLSGLFHRMYFYSQAF
jgi:hypothetical protein